MIDRIAQILRLKPDETRHALAFGATLFALTCSYTLVKTARDALFLAELPVALLPTVYLGGLLASPLSRASGIRAMIVIAAVVLAAVALAVRAAFKTGAVRDEEPGPSVREPANPMRVRYVRWLALASLCSVLVTTLLDYQ